MKSLLLLLVLLSTFLTANAKEPPLQAKPIAIYGDSVVLKLVDYSLPLPQIDKDIDLYQFATLHLFNKMQLRETFQYTTAKIVTDVSCSQETVFVKYVVFENTENNTKKVQVINNLAPNGVHKNLVIRSHCLNEPMIIEK